MSKVDYAIVGTLSTEKELNSYIDAALTGFAKHRDMLQIAMIAILAHFINHGNWQIERVNAFCKDTRLSGAQTNLITSWFAKYGGYTRKPGDNGFTGHEQPDDKVGYVRERFQAAKDNLWYAPALTQDVFQDFDLSTEITKFAKRVAKKQREAIKTGNTDKVNLVLSESAMQQLLNVAKIETLIVLHSDNIKVESQTTASNEEVDKKAA